MNKYSCWHSSWLIFSRVIYIIVDFSCNPNALFSVHLLPSITAMSTLVLELEIASSVHSTFALSTSLVLLISWRGKKMCISKTAVGSLPLHLFHFFRKSLLYFANLEPILLCLSRTRRYDRTTCLLSSASTQAWFWSSSLLKCAKQAQDNKYSV